MKLRATELGGSFDLLAGYAPGGFAFEREGLGVSGIGVRRAAAADEVMEALDEISSGSEPAPVAVGALGWAGEGKLTIPAHAVVRRAPGPAWLLSLADDEPEWRGRALPGPPSEPFGDVQLRAEPEPANYARAVEEAVARISAGEARKVVLARSVLVEAGRELDPRALLARLRAVDPSCYAFAAPTEAGDLVGASPELLVARRGREVRANPLAGSAPRAGDPVADRASAEALLASAKDREEHRHVAEAVREVLEPLCDELAFPDEPEVIGTATVWHLSTPLRGVLREPAPSALDLARLLHPTPAVGGAPREAAAALLRELEPIERGAYAGPVGWVDGSGDGEWAIALRCAEIAGRTARLFAGAGIVAASEPELEVAETERKFRAFLDSLRWG